jgi:hypothetical protein
MVSPSVTADVKVDLAEGRVCPPGDHLSTSNNFWDASLILGALVAGVALVLAGVLFFGIAVFAKAILS